MAYTCFSWAHKYTMYVGDPRSQAAMDWCHQLWSSYWGYSSFSNHTEIHTQNKCVHHLHAPCSIFAHFNLHTQTTVNAGDTLIWRAWAILITGKPEDPNLSPMLGQKWHRFWDLLWLGWDDPVSFIYHALHLNVRKFDLGWRSLIPLPWVAPHTQCMFTCLLFLYLRHTLVTVSLYQKDWK